MSGVPTALNRCDPGLKRLIGELGNLKRIHSAGHTGSIASRLFRRAWTRLVAGDTPRSVAFEVTALALAATRLGDIDAKTLMTAGLSSREAAGVVTSAIRDVGGCLPERLVAEALSPVDNWEAPVFGSSPSFVDALEAQPRAGATCPGKPRVILEPAENHAEHCLIVAVMGVILAPVFHADAGVVFLASLAHHLHNAGLPDSGFTGETLLGAHLHPVMQHYTQAALATLPPALARQVEAARQILPDAGTAEGQAFHAADTIDRVMQIAQHLQAATLTMDMVLNDMALVHDGPVKSFQDQVLIDMGLA